MYLLESTIMSNPVEKTLNAALRKILRPIAKILLRNGIAYGSFSEVARRVFVEVAFEDFTIPRKKQTVSRVSALTGLTRKEVSRIRDTEPDDDSEASQRYNRAIRVISGWQNDPKYSDESGNTLTLSIDSNEPSFASLVRAYSGDIPTKAMLNVLVSSGSVEQNDDKTVSLVKSAYIPSGDPADKINILGTDVQELIATIDHNLTSPPEDRRFQRKVSYSDIPVEYVQEFRGLVNLKAQALLEEFNKLLYNEKVNTNYPTSNEKGKYVSVGIYFNEDSGE